MKTLSRTTDEIQAHFTARAAHYDRSSRWCTDDALRARIVDLARPEPTDEVLDVAVGTGLVAQRFKGRVARIVGLDINTSMFAQAKPHVDELVLAPAEAMPFGSDRFGVVVCRQGIQFMDAPRAAFEMVRVARPGGRIVLVDLCAHGPEDREEYFEILRLRNPARRNFWEAGDVARLLENAGCQHVDSHAFVTEEDVDVWSDNHAIEEERREAIRAVYRNASEGFRKLHSVSVADGRIVDHMLFTITVGIK